MNHLSTYWKTLSPAFNDQFSDINSPYLTLASKEAISTIQASLSMVNVNIAGHEVRKYLWSRLTPLTVFPSLHLISSMINIGLCITEPPPLRLVY